MLDSGTLVPARYTFRVARYPVSCHIEEAAALFSMSPARFFLMYVTPGYLRLDRLHQLHMGEVLAIYDLTPERKQRLERTWGRFHVYM